MMSIRKKIKKYRDKEKQIKKMLSKIKTIKEFVLKRVQKMNKMKEMRKMFTIMILQIELYHLTSTLTLPINQIKISLKQRINKIIGGQKINLRGRVNKEVNWKVKMELKNCKNGIKSFTNLEGQQSTLCLRKLNTMMKNATKCKHKERSLHSAALAAYRYQQI